MSQAGSFTGSEDCAASSAIHATSTGDSENHGAGKAVDGDESSYWRSDPGSDAVQAPLAGLLWRAHSAGRSCRSALRRN